MSREQETILVVDDEAHVRKLLRRVLEEAGYSVLTASSGQEALDTLVQSQNQEPQLIFLDLKMSGKLGIELLPEIKASYPDTAVVMATAANDVSIAVRCMKQGAYDYITKPFNLDEVILCAHRALEKRHLDLEVREYKLYLEEKVAEQTKKIRGSFLSSITALANALEAKDKYTSGHSQRVSDIAASIAGKMGLPPETIYMVRLAGLVHDVGKIGVRALILNKPSRLTQDEFQQIQKHPEIGEHILVPIADDDEILRLVRGHHEHYDGTGYPDGLKGSQIPIGARILAISDAYEAMTSERPYRKAMSNQTAYTEIEHGRGTRFDPVIADVFLKNRGSS